MNNSTIKVGIVGLGYVGLPLAMEFSKKFHTIGFDIDESRVKELKNQIDRTSEVSSESLLDSTDRLKITNETKDISNCNVYVITVPTPVDKNNKPDMSPIASASLKVGKIINKNDVIIYESTVYPYATEEFCVPILEQESGLKYNKDFYCGYSPERINPGDKERSLTLIKKITSGSNKEVSIFVDNLYKQIISAGTYNVDSIAIAEAAKIIENIQRDVNIALINELAMLFNKLDLETNEVLKAAGTKWNFIPFTPGLVGGHCIGVDPYYLTYKAQKIGFNPEMILAGRKINDNMGKYISDQAILNMAKVDIIPKKSRVGIFGLTFKEDCPDLRNSKVPDILKNLKSYSCSVSVTDPRANAREAKNLYNIDLVKERELKNINVIILAVAHKEYILKKKEDWLKLIDTPCVIIDIKSVLDKNFFNNPKIIHWRL